MDLNMVRNMRARQSADEINADHLVPVAQVDQDNHVTLPRFLVEHQEMPLHVTHEVLLMTEKRGNRKNSGPENDHDGAGDWKTG